MRNSTIMMALLAVLLTAGMFATTAQAQAAANERIRFQGRLLDSSGSPITTATSVEFNLYTSPTGGTSVWTETHNVAPSGNGIFSLTLGDQADFSGVDFSQPLYLGVTPDTDPEMVPRYLFTASTAAHFAKDAGTLGGLTSGDFAQLGAASVNFTGNVSAGTFSGDGSGLTSLSASALTGALPALDGSSLTSLDASALTGALPALDGSALTSLSASALTGSLPAIDGSSLTGITAGQITGLGSLAGQDASNVAITGGSIDGTAIGGTTPAAGAFTTLTGGTTNLSSGGVTLTVSTTSAKALDVLGSAEIAGSLDVGGPITALAPITTSGPVNITSPAPIVFNSGSANASNLGSGATANRSWTLPDASGTLALLSDLTGGTTDGNFNSLTVATTGSFGGLLTANDGLSASLTATGVPTTPIVGGHLTSSSDGTETYGALGEATYTGTAIATGEQIIGSHGMAHISNSGAGILAIGAGGQSTEAQLGDNLGVHAWARQGGRNTGLMAVANADFTQQTAWATGLPSNLTVAVLGFNNQTGANDYGLYVEGTNNFIDGDLTVSGSVTGTFNGTISNADQLDNLDSTDFAILANATNTFTGDITANSFSGDGSALTGVDAASLGGTAAANYALSADVLSLGGGTMTGDIVFSGTQSFSGDGSGLTGVDADLLGGVIAGDYALSADVLNLSGGTMTGDITFSGTQTFSGDGSGLTGVDAASLGGIVAGNYALSANVLAVANNLGDLGDVPTARTNLGLGSMALENALDYYTSVQTDTQISNAIAGLGSMSTQDASAVAITGGSGDFNSLTSASGFTSTGGDTSFTSPLATPSATYTAHDFVASVDGNATNTSRALRANMTGTNAGSAEVTGAWLTASGDGDITQGVFGQSSYTGLGGGTSIGLDGRARIFGSTAPHLAIGTAGRADDSQTGSNIGVHAWAANGGKSAGLMAVANATQAEQQTWDGTLPANLTAAVLGFNNQAGADDYGLYVEAANNVVDGDLTVTGNINATITGTVSADNITDGNLSLSTGNITLTSGIFTGDGSGLTGVDAASLGGTPAANYALSADVLSLSGGTMTGNIVFSGTQSFAGDGSGLTGVNAAQLNGFVETDFAAANHAHDAGDINSGTFADALIAPTNVTQHQGLLSLGAGQITSGTLDAARLTGIYAIDISGNAATASDSALLGGQPGSFYLDAANLTGTLNDAQLSSNVALLNAASNAFTGDLSASTLTSLGGVSIGGPSTFTASSATNQNAFDLDITIDNANSAGDIAGETGQGLNVKASTGDVTDQRAIALRGRLVDNFAGNSQARQLRGVNGVVNTDGGDQTSVLGGYFYTRARATTTNGVASLTGAAADAEVQAGALGFTNSQRLTGGRFGVSDLEGVAASGAGVVGTVISDGSWTGTTASANPRTGSSTGVFGLATGSATSNVGVFGAANASEGDVFNVALTAPNAGVYALNPDVTDTQWALVADGRANVKTSFDATATGTPTGLIAAVTGSGMGASAANEVTGARISSVSDGDSLQGLYGRAEYTASAGTGTWAIGIEGDSVVNDAGSSISAIGTVGRATSVQGGGNTGVLAFADGGASNAGLYAAAATQGQLETHAGGLGAISAAILGYNPDSAASDYGLHITAQNNRIDGDLTVTGNINASITGTAADSNQLQGATWDAPLAIGGTTAAAGTFTDLTATGIVSLPGGSITNANLASDTINVTYGTGLSGGASVALGGILNINNTGVLTAGGTLGQIVNTGTAQDPLFAIDPTYIGQSSITTVGTITTGTWQGTAVADTFVADNLTINGGTVDNTIIGGTTPGAGTFTSLTSSSVTADTVAANPGNIESNATNVPHWIRVSGSFGGVGSGTKVNVATLPAGAVVHAVKVKSTSQFTGTGIGTVTLSVEAAGQDLLTGSSDFSALPASNLFDTADVVASWDQAATTLVELRVDDTASATDIAGNADVWLLVSVTQ